MSQLDTINKVLTELENQVATNIASGGARGKSPKRSHHEALAALSAMLDTIIGDECDREGCDKPSCLTQKVEHKLQRQRARDLGFTMKGGE